MPAVTEYNPVAMTMLLKKPVPFRGGLRLPANKAQSVAIPVQPAKVPSLLTIPLRQHIGTAAIPVVRVGEHVLKGQEIARHHGVISAPVHASSSGTVVEITQRPVPSPSGQDAPCIVIESDGQDEWQPHKGIEDDLFDVSPAELHDRINAAGIVGLGGAGFPTAAKMLPGFHSGIHLLVLNAAESEPYISCDEALIRKYPGEIIAGLKIIRRAVQASECVIGIGENMHEAISALRLELKHTDETAIDVATLPEIYPNGGEKQLIQSLTGLEVPSQGLPLDLGIICYNAGTAYAVYKAVTYGEPLISRVVTVTGKAIKRPCNLEALIGTPISELVEQCGGYVGNVDRLLMGGPMMGFDLRSDALPVIKTTNCVLAATADEIPSPQPVLPCIRCGACAAVCPINLLPQQLYWHARANDYKRIQEFKLFDCIECSCCVYVCPSRIPLVQYYQSAKAEINSLERRRLESGRAQPR